MMDGPTEAGRAMAGEGAGEMRVENTIPGQRFRWCGIRFERLADPPRLVHGLGDELHVSVRYLDPSASGKAARGDRGLMPVSQDVRPLKGA